MKLRQFFAKKYLMKRLMRGRLPEEIIRRPKAGFNVPLNRWFRGELREYVRDVLSPAALGRVGFFQARQVERLLDEHARGEVDWSYQIYGLLVFAIWHSTFIEGSGALPRRRDG
jgi:asparagine synthase (glutamine-hydrolysing)